MASASSTSARSLFGESKSRLADRVQVNVNNIASVARQIQRGSKSSEIKFFSKETRFESMEDMKQKLAEPLNAHLQRINVIMQSVRALAHQEQAIENTENNIKKLQLIASHLAYQQESIARSCALIEEVKEQAQAMQR